MTTLLRVLIDASGLSRRKAFAAIREGRVSVGYTAVIEPSAEFEGGRLSLDGELLSAPPAAKTYLLLNKPPGFITTNADELGRRTVQDLVPVALRQPGLHPVGRLDRDTSGLLILTNDGDLTNALTHPRYEVEKEYWLRMSVPATAEQLEALRGGVELDGAVRRPLRLARLVDHWPFELALTIREGHKREVRRMVMAVGGEVTQLRRVREGYLELGTLPEGAVRPLTEKEVADLRKASAPKRGRGSA